MKQELIKKLIPIIEEFADKVLSSFGDLDKIRKGVINEQRKYQDLNEDKEKELRDVKTRKVEEQREYDHKITYLDNAKSDFILKSEEYDKLFIELKEKRKKTEDNLKNSKIELIRAKEIKSGAEEESENTERAKARYELKLSSLKADSERIEKDNWKIEDEKKKLSVRENKAMANEIKNDETGNDLTKRERKIKEEQKEVARLIRLYKLDREMI